MVIFERELRAAGIEAGTAYRVIGRDDGQVLLADDEGHQRSFDPAGGIADRLESYEPADMELRAGDRIRWTRNDRELELVNTHQAEVTGIAGGMVQQPQRTGGSWPCRRMRRSCATATMPSTPPSMPARAARPTV